jgi:hypothetical protein
LPRACGAPGRCCIYDVHQIVGEHAQRHFAPDLRQRLHQEVRRAHPHLKRTEGMLNCFASAAHGLGILIQSPLHRFENALVLPSCDPAFFGCDALIFDCAGLAGAGPVAAHLLRPASHSDMAKWRSRRERHQIRYHLIFEHPPSPANARQRHDDAEVRLGLNVGQTHQDLSGRYGIAVPDAKLTDAAAGGVLDQLSETGLQHSILTESEDLLRRAVLPVSSYEFR